MGVPEAMVLTEADRTILSQGLAALNLALTEEQYAQLVQFSHLLMKWGRVYNLTARLTPSEVVVYHLLDSLAVLTELQRQCVENQRKGNERVNGKSADEKKGGEGDFSFRILDVGAGAGLPAVVLAICQPAWTVHCIDTVAKKVGFVRQAAAELSLGNLTPFHGQVQKHPETYDVLISRAFASLVDFVQWSQHAVNENGVWCAMKGKEPRSELQALSQTHFNVKINQVQTVHVPFLNEERSLVWLSKKAK